MEAKYFTGDEVRFLLSIGAAVLFWPVIVALAFKVFGRGWRVLLTIPISWFVLTPLAYALLLSRFEETGAAAVVFWAVTPLVVAIALSRPRRATVL